MFIPDLVRGALRGWSARIGGDADRSFIGPESICFEPTV
jgi:hypothetical protein